MNPQNDPHNPASDMPQRPSGHNSGRPSQVPSPQTPEDQPQQTFGAPYNQTHQPIYDWQQYHTAWQRYYQQYYHQYYTQQLQTHQQQLTARYADEPKPEAPSPLGQTITGSDSIGQEPSRLRQLHQNLQAKIMQRARAFRRSNHFVPIASATIVILLLLTLQFNRLFIAQAEAYVSPGSTVNVSDTFIADPSVNANVGPEPKLLIPKINVNVPVVYDVQTVNDKQIQAGLEKGVVRYNLSGANSLPGQKGNMVILGHSSNDVFDPGAYKFTFVLLERLRTGDLFYLHYQGKRYVYKVSDQKIIKPTEWKVLQQNNGKPTVILVTCTPTGTALNRLLVYGEQISPDPVAAGTSPAAATETNPAEIPGNSPTFFERLRDILF